MKCILPPRFLCAAVLISSNLLSQSQVEPVVKSGEHLPIATRPSNSIVRAGPSSFIGSSAPSPDYVLGPGDLLLLMENNLDELNNKSFRVDLEGNLDAPVLGSVHLIGLSVQQAQAEMNRRLIGIVKKPDLVIDVMEFKSQPITVLGAVAVPGVYQVQGRMTLFQVLSLAGGARADAGADMTITRSLKWGAIPLPDAHNDVTGQFSEATVPMKAIVSGSDPTQNIAVLPDDIVSVPKAQVVYAVGSVMKPGGYMLGDSNSLSALQVIALSSGFDKVASPSRARILRVQPGTADRLQIPVNLKQIVAGKAPDVSLRADDILFVPDSKTKIISERTMSAAIAVSSGILIYGHY